MSSSDESLMLRYAETGDSSCFEEIFRRYAERLHAFFVRTGPPEHAADLVQITLMHVHRARRDFRADGRFRPWVYAIAANARRELLRGRARRPEAAFDLDRHPEPAVGPATSTAADRLVRRALATLPEPQREVVVLHWFQDLPFAEIAELLGASESAVKVRAHRAYQALAAQLTEDR